jgi:hypothetical protein
MIVSERALKWAMRFYPPLLFQRIWTVKFDTGFTGVHVKIFKSVLNSNYNKTIFGGTIFSAADPFFPILFHQALRRRGYHITLWLKHSKIDYLKPGRQSLYFSIRLDEADIENAVQTLNTSGKFIKTFSVKITNKDGEICAMVHNEVYIKKAAS